MSWIDDFFGMFGGKRHIGGNIGINKSTSDFDGIFDYNSPSDVRRIADSDPFAGKLFDWWYGYNERKDAERMDRDLFKNTGQSWENSPYPWYSYHYNTRTGSSGTSGTIAGFTEEFGVNDAIMRLYKRW